MTKIVRINTAQRNDIVRLRLIFSLIAIVLCLGACQAPHQTAGENIAVNTSNPIAEDNIDLLHSTRDLKAMSFNIRWPNPDDGPNRWSQRRDLVVRTIKNQSPDVLGVQEAYAFQADYITQHLAGYTMIGVGRDDGKQQGEMTAIYFRTARFNLIDSGHLWLSETPDIPGSVGWDASLTRMATWVLLNDENTGATWLILNTHFDHIGQRARSESARLIGHFIREKQGEYGESVASIVMGDFNSAVNSRAYLALCADLDGPRLIDTYAATRSPRRSKNEGTFNSFRGRNIGARIDWLFVTPNATIQSAQIDSYNEDGRYPSDHFPITATLRQ